MRLIWAGKKLKPKSQSKMLDRLYGEYLHESTKFIFDEYFNVYNTLILTYFFNFKSTTSVTDIISTILIINTNHWISIHKQVAKKFLLEKLLISGFCIIFHIFLLINRIITTLLFQSMTFIFSAFPFWHYP